LIVNLVIRKSSVLKSQTILVVFATSRSSVVQLTYFNYKFQLLLPKYDWSLQRVWKCSSKQHASYSDIIRICCVLTDDWYVKYHDGKLTRYVV